MEDKYLFRAESSKSAEELIESLKRNGTRFNFGIRRVFDMKEEYRRQNVQVDDDFKLYQIMICNYRRSYKSMKKNIERAAVLLQPKQIIVYSENGETVVNYLSFTKDFVEQALPEDDRFQQSLPESCQRIIELIETSK